MLTFILILIIVAAVLLIGVVLIQNPKGGIAANFVAPSQIMGVKKSTDVIEKATWVFAVALIVLSLASNFFRPSQAGTENVNESRIKENIENVTVPAAPAQQQPAAGAAQQQPAGAASPEQAK
ncbi:MAG: preprotein translocase subunit SecG [Bacteroidia bacterium]